MELICLLQHRVQSNGLPRIYYLLSDPKLSIIYNVKQHEGSCTTHFIRFTVN